MTSTERWDYFLNENFLSPAAFFRSAGPALGLQWADAPPEWGQGMSGYGKRLADQFASRTIQGSVEHLLSATMKTDPRYKPCDCLGFFPRLGYAIYSNVAAWKYGGRRTFNLPVVAGVYAGTMTSLAWYPGRYGWKDGLRDGSQRMIAFGSYNVFREFWPELRKVVPFARKK